MAHLLSFSSRRRFFLFDALATGLLTAADRAHCLYELKILVAIDSGTMDTEPGTSGCHPRVWMIFFFWSSESRSGSDGASGKRALSNLFCSSVLSSDFSSGAACCNVGAGDSTRRTQRIGRSGRGQSRAHSRGEGGGGSAAVRMAADLSLIPFQLAPSLRPAWVPATFAASHGAGGTAPLLLPSVRSATVKDDRGTQEEKTKRRRCGTSLQVPHDVRFGGIWRQALCYRAFVVPDLNRVQDALKV